jgi:hypothetical protein
MEQQYAANQGISISRHFRHYLLLNIAVPFAVPALQPVAVCMVECAAPPLVSIFNILYFRYVMYHLCAKVVALTKLAYREHAQILPILIKSVDRPI